MARYIVSVIEGAIMLTRTHRDVNVIERQVRHLKEDLKRSFQTTDAIEPSESIRQPLSHHRIRRWASRQLADYDARQPGTVFAEGVVLRRGPRV